MKKFNLKDRKAITLACTIWGISLIGSGCILNNMTSSVPIATNKKELQITQKRVITQKTNEIKLKDIEIEINTPLSVSVKDYLENIDKIDLSIIKELKLDISSIKINEAGTYKYTVTYNKKKYIGYCVIKEKELPNVEITLKSLKLEVGSPISTDLTAYIKETLTDEVKANITIDLSKVSTNEAGIYQYTITYKGKLYTGTIEVYQPQTKIITPYQPENDKIDDTEDNPIEGKDDITDIEPSENDNTN